MGRHFLGRFELAWTTSSRLPLQVSRLVRHFNWLESGDTYTRFGIGWKCGKREIHPPKRWWEHGAIYEWFYSERGKWWGPQRVVFIDLVILWDIMYISHNWFTNINDNSQFLHMVPCYMAGMTYKMWTALRTPIILIQSSIKRRHNSGRWCRY